MPTHWENEKGHKIAEGHVLLQSNNNVSEHVSIFSTKIHWPSFVVKSDPTFDCLQFSFVIWKGNGINRIPVRPSEIPWGRVQERTPCTALPCTKFHNFLLVLLLLQLENLKIVVEKLELSAVSMLWIEDGNVHKNLPSAEASQAISAVHASNRKAVKLWQWIESTNGGNNFLRQIDKILKWPPWSFGAFRRLSQKGSFILWPRDRPNINVTS